MAYVICCGSESRSGRDFDPVIAYLEEYHVVMESASAGILPFRGTVGLCPWETWDQDRRQIAHLETYS